MNKLSHDNLLISRFVEKHFRGNENLTYEGEKCLSYFESEFVIYGNQREFNIDYYVSWDGLHPVIDKLFDVISEDDQQFKKLRLFELGLATDKETVYNAVVEAIEFYNENY